MKRNQHDQPESDLPSGLSMPARRALASAGYTQLEQLSRISEADLKKLHGMGPKAIAQLRDALGTKGLSFAGGKKTQQPPAPNPSIERLAALVGEWRTDINMPLDPPIVTRGRTIFEWSEGGSFLIVRGSVEHPAFPSSTAILGGDGETERYSMLYFDSRGISRLYEMSLTNETWKLWREAPGFSQRFTGKFSEDGDTIAGSWERSSDGANWEHDFDLTYTKFK
ncbi:MAG TPA: hypothetical protein VGE45_19230 [Chloroflexia bacterium]|jgi:hypothetical protein